MLEKIKIDIRACSGGEEAHIFMQEILSMYIYYSNKHKFKVEKIEDGRLNIKSLIIEGENILELFKEENGVHRVQRVPITEKSGRVHTSTISVSVLSLTSLDTSNINKINLEDLRIDTFRAGGHGGQHVNKTESAVRITHIPSGIVVCCQDERSQIQNKEIAMQRLKEKLFKMQMEGMQQEYLEARKDNWGTGDISEHIRTYNFKQNRVTDHRYSISICCLKKILDGDLDLILKKILSKKDNSKKK